MKNRKEFRNWSSKVGLFMCMISVGVNGEIVGAYQTNPVLEFHQGTLTAILDQVPLESILRELRKQTGVTYSIDAEEVNRLISVKMHSLPLATALEKILVHVNYALVVDQQGWPSQVIVVKHSEGSAKNIPTSVDPSEAVKGIPEDSSSPFVKGRSTLTFGSSTFGGGNHAKESNLPEDQNHIAFQPAPIMGMDIGPASQKGEMIINSPSSVEMDITFPSEGHGESMIIHPPSGMEMDINFLVPNTQAPEKSLAN